MYDTIITLISEGEATYDSYGNEIMEQTRRDVYAIPRGVYSSEFYSASQLGLHPSMTFVMTNREDYHGEKIVEHEDKLYTVIRADWTAQRDAISLVCEERTGIFDGNYLTTETGSILATETGEYILASGVS